MRQGLYDLSSFAKISFHSDSFDIALICSDAGLSMDKRSAPFSLSGTYTLGLFKVIVAHGLQLDSMGSMASHSPTT